MINSSKYQTRWRIPPATPEIVALAASAGGLHALRQVLGTLPTPFPAALVVVQHLLPWYPSQLPDLLNNYIPLEAKQAQEGDVLKPSKVYIAPPNRHLLVNSNGTLSLSQKKKVNFTRPSADVLFESIAANFGGRAIAVILTGTGSDGSRGAKAVKQSGGAVIAQDQKTSDFFGMPGAAIANGGVDFILPLEKISQTLAALVIKEKVKVERRTLPSFLPIGLLERRYVPGWPVYAPSAPQGMPDTSQVWRRTQNSPERRYY